MYSKIFDPISKKKFNINSKKGIEILKTYFNIVGGKPLGKIKKVKKMDTISEEIETMEELLKIQEKKIQQLQTAINFYESDSNKIENFNEIIRNIYMKLGWIKQSRRKYENTKNKPDEIPTLEDFRILAIMANLPMINQKNKSINTYGIPI